jgi:hypothetical protein
MILTEERRDSGVVGECLEYLINKKICMEVIGLAKSNRPPGLLYICFRFMITLLISVKSVQLLA